MRLCAIKKAAPEGTAFVYESNKNIRVEDQQQLMLYQHRFL